MKEIILSAMITCVLLCAAVVIFPDVVADEETTNTESIYWVDGHDLRLMMQPQDLNVAVNGTTFMTLTLDASYNLTAIKIVSRDTGFYSEDGVTYHLCIDGVKVEGADINVKDLCQ